ncbi:MAG: hypothetical protein E6J47_05485 [Chloroflexi bacterium]|nr:MAG: hypothetical protein E6J47_05485 [Chloroflexota bacterium]
MSEPGPIVDARTGQSLVGAGGRRIGRVEGVFADYLLVRTGGLLPVDLYVPRREVEAGSGEVLRVALTKAAAYDAWHRPLKQAPHA